MNVLILWQKAKLSIPYSKLSVVHTGSVIAEQEDRNEIIICEIGTNIGSSSNRFKLLTPIPLYMSDKSICQGP